MVEMVLVTRSLVTGEVTMIHVLACYLLVKWVETGRNKHETVCIIISLWINCIDRYTRCATQVGDAYKEYFCSQPGTLNWQYDYIRHT